MLRDANLAVSVVMPAFNCEPFIGEALQSIFSQGVDNIEVIVVDDGSTDKTAEIAAKFDRRVKVVKGGKLGPAGARNLAVKNASSEYLAFLDADDVWLPGKLKAQIQVLLDHPEIKIVYAGHLFWVADPSGVFPPSTSIHWDRSEGFSKRLSGWIYPEMLLDSQIHIITALCHRSVFDEVGGFDGTYGKGSDYDFWIKASRLFEVKRLARDGALYRIHSGGISKRKSNISAQYEIVNRAIQTYGYDGPDGRLGNRKLIAERLAMVCFDHAYSHFWGGTPSVAVDFFGKSIGLGKRDIKTFGYWMLSKLKSIVT
jgi:glycosyltransferase involved in cell wall biosynthesis